MEVRAVPAFGCVTHTLSNCVHLSAGHLGRNMASTHTKRTPTLIFDNNLVDGSHHQPVSFLFIYFFYFYGVRGESFLDWSLDGARVFVLLSAVCVGSFFDRPLDGASELKASLNGR